MRKGTLAFGYQENTFSFQNYRWQKQYAQEILSLYTFWKTSYDLFILAVSYAKSAILGGSCQLSFELNTLVVVLVYSFVWN